MAIRTKSYKIPNEQRLNPITHPA